MQGSGTRRRRHAQLMSTQFFVATDGLIEVSNGTDAITQQAALKFTRAVASMFLRDFNIDLRNKSLEESTYMLFEYLRSQTLNDYISPELGSAYGRALAISVLEEGCHRELPSNEGHLILKRIAPIMC
jgi:hypothetical protein